MVRFAGAEGVVFAALTANAGCPSLRTFAQRALCACAIFRREALEIIRVGADVILVGWFAVRDAPVPSNDAISEIA